MKECPVCHKRYDDSMKFCTADGNQLETIANGTPDTANESKVDSDKAKKKPVWKRILKVFVYCVIGIAVALVAFYNYYTNAATYLRTEPDLLYVAKCYGSYDVDIDFDGYVWDVNYHSDWIHVAKKKNSLSLSIGKNTTGRVREGSVTIKSGKQLAQITIRQNAFATVLRADKTSLVFSQGGGSESVPFESDGFDCSIEKPDWLYVETKKHSIEVECDSNSDEYRTGRIVLREDNLMWSISVKQGGTCNVCHGEGKVPCIFCGGTGGGGFGMYFIPCASCGGRGSHTCTVCDGTGERDVN